MRPPPIILPGIEPSAATRYRDRKTAKPRQPFTDSAGREMKQPAIQGFAALFETAFSHEGRIVYFKSNAFVDTLHDGRPKRLLLDHDAARQVGSSAEGLEFANTTRGLAFRVPLAGDNGATIHRNVLNGDRACLSVGISLDDVETREIAGHQVDIVAKATLKELSLVKEGAVPETFASIVDLADQPNLWSAARRPDFAVAKAGANLAARVRRVTEALSGR